MRIAAFGDVVGRTGREAVRNHLPHLRRRFELDFVVVNGENAAGGFGITEKTARELFAAGADCITLGNHSFDQRDALTYILREPRLIRPLNYPASLSIPGRGAELYTLPDGRRVYVVQVMGRIFMDSLDDPFPAALGALDAAPLGTVADAVIIDIHAEASSEKQAMGYFCDGRASVVFGTHTHVPTADTRILPCGTAFQTDLGMTGDYDSVIGMRTDIVLQRFTTRLPSPRMTPGDSESTLCGLIVDTDDKNGLARHVETIRVGGCLAEALPDNPPPPHATR